MIRVVATIEIADTNSPAVAAVAVEGKLAKVPAGTVVRIEAERIS